MANKTYKQLELESYFERGQAKLRYKKLNTRNTIPDNAPGSVARAPNSDD